MPTQPVDLGASRVTTGNPTWRLWRTYGAQALMVVAAASLPGWADARRLASAPVGTVALAELPAQAVAVEHRILAGGPFTGDKEGSVFANREHALPSAQKGYYREYTVRTPQARDRGARRIVCGGTVADHPEACYYTNDHYRTFRRIVD